MARTPFPPFHDRPIEARPDDGSNYGGYERTGNSFLHTMEGNLSATDAWFRTPGSGALTPWGIGGSFDGDALDGVIYRWYDYGVGGQLQPWSSGPWVPNGMGDGPAYVNTFGVGGINGKAEAIEHSGNMDTPVTQKQWQSSVWLVAAIIHAGGRDSSHYLWNMHHREICILTGKDCPGPRIYNHTQEYQAAVLQILKHYEGDVKQSDRATIAGITIQLPFNQSSQQVTVPAAPAVFVPFAGNRTFTAGKSGAIVRQWAGRGSTALGTLAPARTFAAAGYYHGESVNGEDRWLVQAIDPRGRVH
ncbi:MAG: peptidoglycan recognition protein family protein, partial [Thermomicrobiales bacterium]